MTLNLLVWLQVCDSPILNRYGIHKKQQVYKNIEGPGGGIYLSKS
jgi:hypothetical protein